MIYTFGTEETDSRDSQKWKQENHLPSLRFDMTFVGSRLVLVLRGTDAKAVSMVLDRVFDRSGLPETAERERERPHVLDLIVPERAGGDEMLCDFVVRNCTRCKLQFSHKWIISYNYFNVGILQYL